MAGRQPYRSGGAQRSRRHSAGSYPTIADQASSLYAPVSASIRAVSAAVSASEAKSPAQRRRPSMFGRATRILSRSRAGSTPSEVDEQASALVKKPARNTGSVVRPASSRSVCSRRPSRLPRESSTLGGAHRSSPRPGPLLARGVLRTGAPHRSRRVRRPPSGNPGRHGGPPSRPIARDPSVSTGHGWRPGCGILQRSRAGTAPSPSRWRSGRAPDPRGPR